MAGGSDPTNFLGNYSSKEKGPAICSGTFAYSAEKPTLLHEAGPLVSPKEAIKGFALKFLGD